MLRGSYPLLLVLALSLPEMSHALGLGNMRVESRLNEPLSAQIDIVGATADELKTIRASVANPEIFQRYGAKRPAFLSSASISVGIDSIGKPVLNIRSTEAFTEPLVELLIDLRSGPQQLVREYSLLLDPSPATAATAVSAPEASNNAPESLVDAPVTDVSTIVLPSATDSAPPPAGIIVAAEPVAVRSEMQYRVRSHDTLRAIVHRAGAHSEADQQRLMLAIFKANRDAFGGNINLLHSGALVTIPRPAQMQLFDSAGAEREIRAQTTTWRGARGPPSEQAAAPLSLRQTESSKGRASVPEEPDVSALTSKLNQLEGQVQFLQQTLEESSRQLASANTQLDNAQRRERPDVPLTGEAAALPAKSSATKSALNAMLGALALMMGALACAWQSFRNAPAPPRRLASVEEPTLELPVIHALADRKPSVPDPNEAYSVTESVPDAGLPGALDAVDSSPEVGSTDEASTMEMAQVVDINVDALEEQAPGWSDEADTVVMQALERDTDDTTNTVLDFNLADLDGQAQHVEMPGTLRDQVVAVERRKNVVDTLMAALKRDPMRSDLRMKLLETLYSAAASNLRIFKEVVRDLARHPERVTADEWEQIMVMGRLIAADDPLFADQPSDRKIADCA